MSTLAQRLRRLEAKLARRMATSQEHGAKEMLLKKIESLAPRLRAGGCPIPDEPSSDAMRTAVAHRLARLVGGTES